MLFISLFFYFLWLRLSRSLIEYAFHFVAIEVQFRLGDAHYSRFADSTMCTVSRLAKHRRAIVLIGEEINRSTRRDLFERRRVSNRTVERLYRRES